MDKTSTDLILEQKLKDLARKGMVFSEPLREGEYTLITASEYDIRPKRIIARPVAAIIIGPQGVKVRPLRSLLRYLGVLIPILGIVFYGAMLILHPPWKPSYSLIEDVRKLIETVRQKY